MDLLFSKYPLLKREPGHLNYQFKVQVNWSDLSEQDYLEKIGEQGNKKIAKNPFELPNRLWGFLLKKIDINSDSTWNQLGKKNKNRLINVLMNDVYEVREKLLSKRSL